MNRKEAEKIAFEFGAFIDWSCGHPLLDAKPGYWFPSNTTHCVYISSALTDLKFWLEDMERCGINDCEVCCDVSDINLTKLHDELYPLVKKI